MRRVVALAMITGSLTLLACDDAPEPTVDQPDLVAAGRVAMAVIDAEALRAPLAVLSSDEYGGRAPASPGDEMTQAFLADQMEALDLEPGAADGSWTQPFEIVGITSQAPRTWRFLGPRSGLDLKSHTESIAFSGTQNETAALESAELVFVGYGIQAPEYDWDDYKEST